MENNFIVGRRIKGLFKNWEVVDLNYYQMEKPIILILGGNRANTEKAANGYAKIIQSHLGVFLPDVDVLSISYQDLELNSMNEIRICNELVDKLFLPLVCSDGDKIDFDKACRNMRKVNVFGHCYGDYQIFDNLIECLQQRMVEIGYSSQEIEKIVSQIFLVSYASNVRSKKIPVNSLSILSPADNQLSKDSRFHLVKLFIESLDGIVMSEKDRKIFKGMTEEEICHFLVGNRSRCYVLPEGNTLRLLSANFSNDIDSDHSLSQLTRKKNWDRGSFASLTGETVSKCLAASLCNAVSNSLINIKGEKLVEFDLQELRWQLEEICKKTNRMSTDILLVSKLQEYEQENQ